MYQLDRCGSKEKTSDLAPSSHSTRGPSPISATARSLSDLRSLSDIRNCQVPLRLHLSRTVHPDIQLRRNHPTSRKARPPQQRPSAETPASTLDTAHQQDFSIHGVSYAIRLSSHSKCFNSPISVGAVMNSDGYLCTSIPTIKRYYLSSYKETQHANNAVMEIRNICISL